MIEANNLYQKVGYRIIKRETIGKAPNEMELIDYMKELI